MDFVLKENVDFFVNIMHSNWQTYAFRKNHRKFQFKFQQTNKIHKIPIYNFYKEMYKFWGLSYIDRKNSSKKNFQNYRPNFRKKNYKMLYICIYFCSMANVSSRNFYRYHNSVYRNDLASPRNVGQTSGKFLTLSRPQGFTSDLNLAQLTY